MNIIKTIHPYRDLGVLSLSDSPDVIRIKKFSNLEEAQCNISAHNYFEHQ